jgi:hypothetical protein
VSTTRTCAVFMGSTSVPPATKEGVPACSLPDIIVASP